MARPKSNLITVRRRPRTPVPKEQITPRGRFVRLAPKRVSELLNVARRTGNIFNRTHYEYTLDEVAAIDAAISRAMSKLNEKLKEAKQPRPEGAAKTSLVEVFKLQA